MSKPSFWPSFAVPCDPENGTSVDSKEAAKKRERLTKRLAAEQLRVGQLRAVLAGSIQNPRDLAVSEIRGFNVMDDITTGVISSGLAESVDLPLNKLKYSVGRRSTPKAAGANAVLLTKCLNKMIELKEQLDQTKDDE